MSFRCPSRQRPTRSGISIHPRHRDWCKRQVVSCALYHFHTWVRTAIRFRVGSHRQGHHGGPVGWKHRGRQPYQFQRSPPYRKRRVTSGNSHGMATENANGTLRPNAGTIEAGTVTLTGKHRMAKLLWDSSPGLKTHRSLIRQAQHWPAGTASAQTQRPVRSARSTHIYVNPMCPLGPCPLSTPSPITLGWTYRMSATTAPPWREIIDVNQPALWCKGLLSRAAAATVLHHVPVSWANQILHARFGLQLQTDSRHI